MTPVFSIGHANLPCWEGTPRLSRPKLDVDRLSGTYVTAPGTSLKGGDALPGYSGMIIFDCEETSTSTKKRWRIDAQGSLDGSNPTKVISNGKRRTLDEGWDQRTVTVKTWDATLYPLAAEHPTYPFLYVTDVDENNDDTAWATLAVTYRGMEEEKPFKRRITGTANVTATRFTGTVLDKIYFGFPPIDSGTTATLSGTDLDIEFDSPGISLTDTFVTTTPPPTDFIGKFWTPNDVPSTDYFSLVGDGTKYFVPFGWKCVNIVAEQIADKSIWLISITWIKQVPSMPTT